MDVTALIHFTIFRFAKFQLADNCAARYVDGGAKLERLFYTRQTSSIFKN